MAQYSCLFLGGSMDGARLMVDGLRLTLAFPKGNNILDTPLQRG